MLQPHAVQDLGNKSRHSVKAMRVLRVQASSMSLMGFRDSSF